MKTLTGYLYYPDSLASHEGATFFLVRSEDDNAKYLGVLGDSGKAGFTGFQEVNGTLLCQMTSENAAQLRQRLPWLRPQALGLRTTAGFGDRLGVATPGHVTAMREVLGTESEPAAIAPIYAQQSVRENARTRRTPQQVMDDAMWGVFQTGWRQPWGADADHLKTIDDIDSFFDAGFTFFTIDPGEHVDNAAQTDDLETLKAKVNALPWDELQSTPDETAGRYLDLAFAIPGGTMVVHPNDLSRALAKYGKAIAHTLAMTRHLQARANGQPFDLEVSVDETDTPTSPVEHFLVASELRRLQVPFTSLAPRFVGRFEKGVDYIGSLAEFETEFARHAAIARWFGNYRLSLHSGSDKFSVYEIATRYTGGLIHLKTAGTSYLEALRVVAEVDPAMFRKILNLALERYEVDRASYHVSAQLAKVATPHSLPDEDLPALLDQFDARQVFHVTFGAVLDRFGPTLCAVLREHENIYHSCLASHFKKHLTPLKK